jgi:uncharacterized protein YjbI with pentapeptide repeats
MDTDARESRPAAANRAPRSAAVWATPLSILAGAVSVFWSARQLRAQAPSSPASAGPPAALISSLADGQDPADKSRVGRFFKIWATPLSMIGAAISLLWSVYQFNAQQNANLEQQQASQLQALDQQRQTTLNDYLNDMSSLLLADKLGSAPSGSPVRAIAVARTDTAIRNLDGNRKGTLVRFLWEANLINNPTPVVRLYQVNLHDADFVGANLQHADLSTDAQLNDADLQDTDLVGSDLVNADLSAADLTSANLSCSTLGGGVVVECGGARGADLDDANLVDADLTSADLQGANLSRADLLGAQVTASQLAQASSIQGAMLPNGSIAK